MARGLYIPWFVLDFLNFVDFFYYLVSLIISIKLIFGKELSEMND